MFEFSCQKSRFWQKIELSKHWKKSILTNFRAKISKLSLSQISLRKWTGFRRDSIVFDRRFTLTCLSPTLIIILSKSKKAVSFFLLKKLGFSMGPYRVRRERRSRVWQCQIIFWPLFALILIFWKIPKNPKILGFFPKNPRISQIPGIFV